MDPDFIKAQQLIDSSERILLTMHEGMDGDDGGAILALGQHLESLGKQPTYFISKGVPPQLAFLPQSHQVKASLDNTQFDLIIFCGCATADRCGNPAILNLTAPTINIDHHPDNQRFGQVNIVDASKSAVAELVYDMFVFHRWPITKNIALCLLTGLVTDTGSFMHSNTQTSTLTAAAELMRKGALVNKIIRHTYKNKNPQMLKAWGRALENMRYDDKHQIAFSVITDEDLETLGDIHSSTFEGFVETLNAIPEAKFALFLRQEGNKVKGSLRSEPYKNIDVAQIAQLFGGGGHKMAAGFSVVGKLTKNAQGKWQVV